MAKHPGAAILVVGGLDSFGLFVAEQAMAQGRRDASSRECSRFHSLRHHVARSWNSRVDFCPTWQTSSRRPKRCCGRDALHGVVFDILVGPDMIRSFLMQSGRTRFPKTSCCIEPVL
jgi:hypothetical protein